MFGTAHLVLYICLNPSSSESTEDSETEEGISFWRYEIVHEL